MKIILEFEDGGEEQQALTGASMAASARLGKEYTEADIAMGAIRIWMTSITVSETNQPKPGDDIVVIK